MLLSYTMRRIAALVTAALVAAASSAGASPQPFEDCLPRADHVPGTSHAYPAREAELSCWSQDLGARIGPLERLSRLAPRAAALRERGAMQGPDGAALRAAEAEARRAVRAASEAVDDLARRYERLSEASSSGR